MGFLDSLLGRSKVAACLIDRGTGLCLRGGGGIERRLGIGNRGASGRKLPRQFGMAIRADEPFGGRRADVARDIAVPAAQLAVARDDTLADRERLPVVLLDHADLREPPRQCFAAGDMRRKRIDAGRQRRIARLRLRAHPAARTGAPDWRIQIVAQRRRQRAFVA